MSDNVGPGYEVFYETVSDGIDALIEAGWEPEVKGMAWMQGESDACWDVWADAYEDNLTHFIDRVREDVRSPSMAFVAGLIDCRGLCGWRDTVRAATENVAAADLDVELRQGVATLEDGLYTLEQNLQDPAMVDKLARFVRASMKGWT